MEKEMFKDLYYFTNFSALYIKVTPENMKGQY